MAKTTKAAVSSTFKMRASLSLGFTAGLDISKFL